MSKLLYGTSLLVTGFLVGLVISGRTAPTSAPDISAAPKIEQSRSATLATSALPDLSDVAEHAVQASVNISSTQYVQVNPYFKRFYGDTMRSGTSLGSGVIVSSDGYILTNSHVISGDNDLRTTRTDIRVTLPDNRELPGKLVGIDTVSDLAVIKVEAQNLVPIPWGDSSKLKVAQWVLAIGNPFAFSQTVTLGIVSAVNRHDPQLGGYSEMIQTDAAINPGNSGGPLINSQGELIGINTMIYSETGGYQGIGFAIPANLARSVMSELIQNHEVVRGTIGITALRNVDPDRAERAGYGRLKGVLVSNMFTNASAYKAGVQLDDIITSVNGQDVSDAQQLQRMILDAKVGSTLKLSIIRDRRAITVNVPVEKAVPVNR
ncbi:MAG TPA: trypsin-like peptidase domain-containing protein [Vicinamibacterales bacterium]|nr:trypsin-like peptidase domain-containing protein [Vicinamibacterales bacterium]